MKEATLTLAIVLALWAAVLTGAVLDNRNRIFARRTESPAAPAVTILESSSPNTGLKRSDYMDALFACRDEAVAAHALFMEHFGHADDCPKKNSFFEETCPCGFLDVLNAIGGIGEKPLESVMEGR